MSTDVGTWTNWFTFEPNPDYSLNARIGLLSSILYALQRRILSCRENLAYRYSAPAAAVRHGFKWLYSPRGVGTTLSEVHALIALHRVPFLFVRWFVQYQSRKLDILKANALIFLQIVTSGPRCKGMKRSTLGAWRSRLHNAADRFGGVAEESLLTPLSWVAFLVAVCFCCWLILH